MSHIEKDDETNNMDERNRQDTAKNTQESGQNKHIAADNELKQQIRHGVVMPRRVRHPIYPL